MTSEDDIVYRKSVRNMSVVIAAIVLTVFAAIFVPPFLSPHHNVFQSSVSFDSDYGFTMHLTLNSTSVSQTGGILVTGWVNSTSSSVENVTAANAWALPQSRLWGKICISGWPIGVGVMKGHYTQDNYSVGQLILVPHPLSACPEQAATPPYFLFEPHSSRALVTLRGNPAFWIIQTSLAFRQYQSGNNLQPGVYTAVLADEWGDVLTSNFLVG